MDDRDRTRLDAGDATTGTMLQPDHSLDVLLDGEMATTSCDVDAVKRQREGSNRCHHEQNEIR